MTETNKTLLNLGLTAFVSAATGLAVSELSKDDSKRSASVGGANIDGEAIKAQIKESLYNDWLNDPIVQNRLRGPIGLKGDTGANGQMARVDQILNHNGYDYAKGVDIGNGEVWGVKNSNLSLTENMLVRMIYDATFGGKFQLLLGGNVGLEISGDGSAKKIGGGSWSTISDERLKDNVENFTNGLAKILAIEIKSFNYKKVEGTPTALYPESITSKKQFGVIAQQLKEVCPEMVAEDADGFLSVDLSNLNLMLVNAVKELDKKDKAQQTTINQYKTRIEALETGLANALTRLEALEAPQA